jgi:conjugative transfer signal peptidase TraF
MNAILRNSALAAFGMALILVLCWCAGLRINLTPSLPQGVYALCPGAPSKGDFVSFCLEGEFTELARERGYLGAGSCPSGLRPLLKILSGLPGDSIQADALVVRSADSQGRPMPSVLQSGVIPTGMALVLAEHPGSFDSRYFGLVPLENLQRVKAVWIW